MTDSVSQPASQASTAHRVWSRLAPYFAATSGYLLLAALAFASLITGFASAIPGIVRNTDYSIFYWNVWWFQHAILQLGQNPFYTNYILFPHTLNLAYHTLTPFLDVMAFPLYAAFGINVAINGLILGSLVFSGVAMFAFLRHHHVPNGLAFVGGVGFVFSSFVTARVSFVHLNMLPIGWLPLSLLVWDRLVECPTVVRALILSGVLYAAFMTDPQFGIWIAFLLAPYALFSLIRARQEWKRLIAMSVLSVAILVGFMLIAPLPQLLEGRGVTYPTVSLDQAQVRATRLADLIVLPPRFIGSERVTLGLLLPILVVLALIRGRRDKTCFLWSGLAGFFLLLALGPTFEPLNLPLPYRLVHWATGSTFRVPARFLLPAEFALIVFVAFSLREDYQRLPRIGRAILIVAVIVLIGLENKWYEPFPVFTLPDYRIYHTIGADPEAYTVLEVPLGAHNTIADPFGKGMELVYYAAQHHKRLINGAVSRAEVGLTASYRQWPLLTAFAEEGPPPNRAAAQAELQSLGTEWDIRYIVVHRDMLSPDLANWTIGFLNSHPAWCLTDEEGDVIAYRRMQNAACAPDLLDLPADGLIKIGEKADRYLGPGWYPAENVGGPQARWTGGEESASLRIKLMPQDYRVSLNATSFLPDQKVAVFANEHHLADLAIQPGWAEVQFDLPASVIPLDRLVTLKFVHTLARSAYDQTGGQSEDRRPLAVAYESIQFAPP